MLNVLEENVDKKQIKLLKKVCKEALKQNGQSPRTIEINLELIGAQEMQELNKRTRNVDEATDVLSFPNLVNIFNKKITKKEFKNDINPENGKVMLGDIAINVEKVQEQSVEYGHSYNRELCYLLVHGILHLLEFDHMDELDKNLMRAREELILNKFKLAK